MILNKLIDLSRISLWLIIRSSKSIFYLNFRLIPITTNGMKEMSKRSSGNSGKCWEIMKNSVSIIHYIVIMSYSRVRYHIPSDTYFRYHVLNQWIIFIQYILILLQKIFVLSCLIFFQSIFFLFSEETKMREYLSNNSIRGFDRFPFEKRITKLRTKINNERKKRL